MAETYSDEQLVQMFQVGDNPHYAFNLLIKKHQEKIYYFARKLLVDHDDANDVTQNIFLKVFTSLSKFRSDSTFSTWLYRIASNECFEFLRKKKKNIFQSIEDVQRVIAERIDTDPMYDGDEIRKKLDKAVLTLPSKQRLIFTLKYFEEKKFSEISEITGTSEGALKASYHHAVKKIEGFLKEN